MNQQKATPQKLTLAELKNIKGGYREMPGTISGSITVRWDEITIRMQDRDGNAKGLMSRPGTNPGGMQAIMP